jgi:hydrogenase expression/formation protein HypD
MSGSSPERELKFRDPARAAALTAALARVTAQVGRAPVSVMHVCGSHEQAIARFGLRAVFPRDLHVIMGPGCPVCITDQPEVDEAVALARQGVRMATSTLRAGRPSRSSSSRPDSRRPRWRRPPWCSASRRPTCSFSPRTNTFRR